MANQSHGGPVTPRSRKAQPASRAGSRSRRAAQPGDEDKPRKPLWRRLVKWGLITGVVMFVLAIAGLFFAYRAVSIPDANAEFLTQTTKVYYSDGKHKIGDFQTQNRTSIGFDEMPQTIKDAVIAAEDRSFYTNQGLDFKGIARALRDNATTSGTSGGSTITQQYVKVLYLTQDRTMSRKAKEAILSIKVHNQMSKEEILEGYLNTIYFGNGAYGIEAASQTYFGHKAAKLTAPQAAMLSSVINNPSAFDPYDESDRDRLMGRYTYVLDGMRKAGNITEEDYAKYVAKLPKVQKQRQSNRFGGTKGFLLRLTEQQLRKEGFSDSQITGGGLKVVTTFDYDAQKAAVETVKEMKPDGLKELNVALSAVDPETGALRAMYGGPNYLKSQLNWAMLGSQPGSSFKPFAVAAALSDGYGLKTQLDGSSPLRLKGGAEIENQGDSGGRSFGPVSLEYATQESVNTAFVDLTYDVMEDGGQKTIDAARRAGLSATTTKRYDPSVAVVSLGYAPVPNVEMAAAYATFANKGKQNDWYVIQRVRDRAGEDLHNHTVRSKKAFSEAVSADVTKALQDVVGAGSGTNGRTMCPTAGKTGTATFQKVENGEEVGNAHVSSSWFVGFTPKLSTAVMYVRGKNGNEALNGYMPTFYGGQYPAKTFSSFMNKVLDGGDCGEFPPAANIKSTKGKTFVPVPTETQETERPKKDRPDRPSRPGRPTRPAPTMPTMPTQPTDPEPPQPTRPTQPTDPGPPDPTEETDGPSRPGWGD
ncbi:transglycosylase domain-containing protein [Mumia zhuanghuii]|uniref:transglycosylase domain-containing protein n=1 Tax=Mumia zhuanghuii TaxID=2585211 RepID=UPI001891C3E6|nr:transglycosylase domain-containing protein [Mumia zhuanghuii]